MLLISRTWVCMQAVRAGTCPCKRMLAWRLWGNSRPLTSLEKGNLRISSSVDFWYLRISLRATVPGR